MAIRLFLNEDYTRQIATARTQSRAVYYFEVKYICG